MAARLAETEGVGLSLVAHAQLVQQWWVNESHTHSMVSAELSKVEQELDHMHSEWTRLTKENEKIALQLEENGNHGNLVHQLLPYIQLKNIKNCSRKWVWLKHSMKFRRRSYFSSGDPLLLIIGLAK